MPIFLSRHEFELKMVPSLRDVLTHRGKTPIFHEDRDTEYFLSTLTKADAASIRTVKTVVKDVFTASRVGTHTLGVAATIRITLREPRKRTVEMGSDNRKLLRSWTWGMCKRTRQDVTQLLKVIQSRGGGGRFQLQDLHDLRKLVSAAYR